MYFISRTPPEHAILSFLLPSTNQPHFRETDQVGIENDDGTSKYGESFYAFAPKCVKYTFGTAWQVEKDRCRDRNLLHWHNESIW